MKIKMATGCILLLFFCCTQFIWAEDSFTEIKDLSDLKIESSDLQCRKIAKIRLKNGLEAILISDAKADKSAAALSVYAGSWQDGEHPGIAHFTEHMLFQGSKACPSEEAFWRFIYDHGGITNANTSSSRTVYFFSVNHSSFEEGLHIFSHFFIDPLFGFTNVKKEMHAVDQEHNLYLENDSYRIFNVLRVSANPNHPFSQFSCGNSETLSKISRDTLIKWVEENYSADKMHLVIYSALPLDTLKALAVEKFQNIPAKSSIKKEEITAPLFSKNSGGSIAFISALADVKNLSMIWEIPFDYNKVGDLIAFALTKGDKSLLAYLKKEGLAINIVFSPERLSKKSAIFEIEIELTDKGVQNYKDVIQKTFEALSLLKRDNIPQYLFDELKFIGELNYKYQEREEASNFVMDMAVDLNFEEIATYPRRTLLPTIYSKEQNIAFLNNLTPEDCHFYLCSKSLNIILDKKEKWSDTPYTIKPIEEKELAQAKSALPNTEIEIVKPNPFLPSSLKLADNTTKEGSLEDPAIIDLQDKGVCFFIKECKAPFISYTLYIRSPLLKESENRVALSDLYVAWLSGKLSPLINEGKAAGIATSISYDNFAIVINLSGYNDKVGPFLQSIITKMRSLSIYAEEFAIYKSALLSQYDSLQKQPPFMQVADYLANLTEKEPTLQEKMDFINRLNFEEFSSFQKSLLTTTFVYGILSGNLTKEEGEKLFSLTQSSLNSNPYPVRFHKKKPIFSLLGEGPYKLNKTIPSLGNALILVIEFGEYSPKMGAIHDVLNQAVKEAFFTALRTEQKTCYIAKSFAVNKEGKLFLILGVQSATNEVEDLLCRFEIFLDDFSDNLPKKITKERFESIKQNLCLNLELPPKNIAELTDHLNLLAITKKRDFNFIKNQIQGLKELSYEDFLKSASILISKENKKRLAIGFEGKLPEDKKFVYSDVERENLSAFCSYDKSKDLAGGEEEKKGNRGQVGLLQAVNFYFTIALFLVFNL